MAGDEHGPPTRETARRLDEIAERLGKLQAQLDDRQPVHQARPPSAEPDDELGDEPDDDLA